MKRTAILLYGVANYLFGVAALVYLIAFIFNLYLPKTIDTGDNGSPFLAALVDLGLIGLFAVQHSIMARRGFKRWLIQHLSPAAERSTYMLATAVVVFALCLFWQPFPQIVWRVESAPLSKALLAIGLGGWGMVLASSFMIDHFELFGLKQVWLNFRQRQEIPTPFRLNWFYRYIRHPIMTGVFIGIWVTPAMTVGHLIFALAMSIYILIGVHHEEKDLIGEFDQDYRQYMRQTGRFLPKVGGSVAFAREVK